MLLRSSVQFSNFNAWMMRWSTWQQFNFMWHKLLGFFQSLGATPKPGMFVEGYRKRFFLRKIHHHFGPFFLWEFIRHVCLHICFGFSWDVSSCNMVLRSHKGGTGWKLCMSKHLLGKVESILPRFFNLFAFPLRSFPNETLAKHTISTRHACQDCHGRRVLQLFKESNPAKDQHTPKKTQCLLLKSRKNHWHRNHLVWQSLFVNDIFSDGCLRQWSARNITKGFTHL